MTDVIPAEWRDAKVSDLVDINGQWRLNELSWLPIDITNCIRAVAPPVPGLMEDRCAWPGDKCGNFTVSSAYNLMRTEDNEVVPNHMLWKKVWKLEVNEHAVCKLKVCLDSRDVYKSIQNGASVVAMLCEVGLFKAFVNYWILIGSLS
ncbi:hypothetical protein L195_g002013 [Trifolium pratense]|uniref:Uncharacterized protein n=1 Tax=Trifolium pratense TaxID=57577 RepID=A0A2K3NR99_TRIPR|nr:hypothetical protein L195_g002013 [Trifolium pratense]